MIKSTAGQEGPPVLHKSYKEVCKEPQMSGILTFKFMQSITEYKLPSGNIPDFISCVETFQYVVKYK